MSESNEIAAEVETVPRAAEAEKAIIGAILQRPDALDLLAAEVQPGDFYSAALGECWRQALRLRDQGTAPDMVNLADAMEKTSALAHKAFDAPSGGWIFWLSIIGERALKSGWHNGLSYARQIADAARRRRYLQVAGRLSMLAVDPELPTADLPGRMVDAVLRAVGQRGLRSVDARQVRSELWDQLTGPRPAAGPAFGLALLDDLILLQPGRMAILAARTSEGKTSLLECIAEHNVQQGRKVMFCSTEMQNADLETRRLSRLTGIPYRQMVNLAQSNYAGVADVIAEVDTWPGRLYEMPGPLDLAGLRAEILARAAAGVNLVIVDYVQMIDAPGRSNYERNSAVARGLKDIALEAGVPILAAAQLRRTGDAESFPTMHDVKESGEYENSADVLVLFQRDRAQSAQNNRVVVCQVVKNRNGQRGEGVLLFNAPRFQFSDA